MDRVVGSVALELLAQEEHLNAAHVILVQLMIPLVVSVTTVWSGNGLDQAMALASLVDTIPTK